VARTRSTACSPSKGPDRAHDLIEHLIDAARQRGAYLPFLGQHRVHQHDPDEAQVRIPGDQRSSTASARTSRWNAMAMVLRANKHTNVGGHIASFASAATLYDVGFNHFWHAPSDEHGGDLVFFQGHSATGVYARAFMLGRLTEEQLDNFRQEVDGAASRRIRIRG
jgi:pyruvate dehydrogenase E1 component